MASCYSSLTQMPLFHAICSSMFLWPSEIRISRLFQDPRFPMEEEPWLLLHISASTESESFMANRMGRFSPSGNFLAVRAELFWQLGGFPLANVNEDGILGQRISRYCREHRLKARFNLDLKTGHYAKRFKRGPLKTLLFYSYVFGNFSPGLARFLAPVEKNSGEVFRRK